MPKTKWFSGSKARDFIPFSQDLQLNILGIETSCDETGVAIYSSEQGLVAHQLYSQVALHAEYGGVVPELASRDHVRKLIPLIRATMDQASMKSTDIQGVAYTAGPGLAGALLSGAAVGRSLAWTWNVPAVEVHHMEGHLLAPMLEDQPPAFPFVALLVSGGHTMLVKVDGIGQYQLLGESLDDAAGEAFDKSAKMMGLGYPGGPAIAARATLGNAQRFRFPRPMTDRPGLDFSFSGLKTYALTTMQKESAGLQGEDLETLKNDIARAFEDAVVDTLMIKCRRAVQQAKVKTLVLAGGVAANQRLREKMNQMMMEEEGSAFYPRLDFCTDNGAMIAYAGWQRLKAGADMGLAFFAKPRWSLMDLQPPSG